MRDFNHKNTGNTRAVVYLRFSYVVLVLLLCRPVQAQEEDPAPSRASQIQTQQVQKAADLRPEEPTVPERRFVDIQNLAEALLIKRNPHLQFGGLATGSGFAAGPVFWFSNSTDSIRANFSAVGSIAQYYKLQSEFMLPRFGSRDLSFTVRALHSDYPGLDYYGPGPNSLKSNRTDYRQEDTVGEAVLRWSALNDRLIMQARGGGLFVNVGPGTDGGIAQANQVFSPSLAPGIDVQTNFLHAASSIDVDLRDSKADPHKGWRLLLQYDRFSDLKRNTYSFGETSADTQFYIPYFNQKRVLVLRALTELTHPEHNNVVPFYLQPILGVEADFRGFRPYRFRDNNLLLFNVEHRWEISSGFDMALFFDSGRVFNHARQINLSHLQNSVGFGFRFKSRNAVVMRIDTGFSREGFQTWLKFGNVF
jgi:outer membrane protein assembly factor BamA